MNNSAFWKSDWFLGLGITLLFCLAYLTRIRALRSTLEQKAYDVGVSESITPADNRIVILDIDDTAPLNGLVAGHGPRSVVGDAIQKLSDAGARLIGVDIFYTEKQQVPRSVQAHFCRWPTS